MNETNCIDGDEKCVPGQELRQNSQLNRNSDRTSNVAAAVSPTQHFRHETKLISGRGIAIHFGLAAATQYPVDFGFLYRIPILRERLASGKRPMHLPKNL